MSAFPALNPGIYNVRLRTYEGVESTVEVKADSEADACGIAEADARYLAGPRHGEVLYAYFLQAVAGEDV